MTNPNETLLTVALLTYNRERYVAEAIDAILAQTYRNFRFLILDNGSTDRTLEIIRSYDDDRIEVIANPVNGGFLYNWRQAMARCGTKYLQMTHDDDRMKPGFLAACVQVLEEDPSVNLVSTNISLMDETSVVYVNDDNAQGPAKPNRYRMEQFDFIREYVGNRFNIAAPTVMLRHSVLMAAGITMDDAGPASDTLLWAKLNLLPGAFCFLSEPLYDYRVHHSRPFGPYLFKLRRPLYQLIVAFDPHLAQDWNRRTVGGVVKELRILRDRGAIRRQDVGSLAKNAGGLPMKHRIGLHFYRPRPGASPANQGKS